MGSSTSTDANDDLSRGQTDEQREESDEMPNPEREGQKAELQREEWDKWLNAERERQKAELQREKKTREVEWQRERANRERELQGIEEEGRRELEQKRASEEMKKKDKEIQELRNEVNKLKPGVSIEFPEENITFPKKTNVGLFGTTGDGKSSLLNSLKFAIKGKLTEFTREQTSTANFQGGHGVRRLPVVITEFLTFIDNRGVGAEDLETIDAGNEIISRLERKSSFPDKVNWREESISKKTPVNESKRVYCTVLVFDSSLTNQNAVKNQIVYDGNSASTQGTSSNPIWKIGTKLRRSVNRCPSFLTLIQTFLQMIIALAIFLAGSPVLVTGVGITERITLQAGKPGVVPFNFQWPPNSTSQGVPFFTLGFKSKPRPFSINGDTDIEGFKSSSQLSRFTTSVTDLHTSPCVNLTIDNVDTLDEDGYILTVIWDSFENVWHETMVKEIVVQFPPGPAKCFITFSENGDSPSEVHCRATTGSKTTTLSCYQNDQKIDVRGDITDNGQVTTGIFMLPDYTHFSCCSHDVTSYVGETTCNDFVWPHGKETTRQSVNTVPTSVTTLTPQIESHLESGACRQSMLPFVWHSTYLFICFLAYVTMY